VALRNMGQQASMLLRDLPGAVDAQRMMDLGDMIKIARDAVDKITLMAGR
jgi:hypothetical protein